MPTSLVEWYDAYGSLGLRVIPLRYKTKQPLFDGWQHSYNYDARLARSYFATGERYNMGLLLGELVDVEGDSPEANELLDRLTAGTPHPRYRSSKSVHHLFANPDPCLTRRVIGDIEFRAYRHQSVLPPSVHETGAHYSWVGMPAFPAPAMPSALLDFYQRKTAKRPAWSGTKPGHKVATCVCCRRKFHLHRKRYDLELRVFSRRRAQWSCQECRGIDLRSECKKLKHKIKS